MPVRPHHSQHELAETIPLYSTRATVTRVDALDRDRTDEVVTAVRRQLDDHGRDEWLPTVSPGGQDVDWERLWALVHDAAVTGPFERVLRTLQERYERTYPSLVRVRFEPADPVEFVSGEYVAVHFHHIPRPYSLSSSPNRPDLEICVRRVPGGRLSTQLCSTVEPGDELLVRGPYGSEFVLHEPSGRDLAFLATGTGVAPFKSMIDYTFEEGRDRFRSEERDVWLFLGSSWADDLPYREAFEGLAADHDNFHFVPTLSRESSLSDWNGETAYVQQTFLEYLDEQSVADADLDADQRGFLDRDPVTDIAARIDPGNLEVYACGINAMVYALTETAAQVGVPERVIRSEGYG